MRRVRVKICCIQNLEEARIAIDYGADALGFVGEMPSGPGVIPDHISAEIIERIPPPIATFLLTSRRSAEDIIAHYQRVKPSTLQIVDRVEHPDHPYPLLRQTLPQVKLVQVVHVLDQHSLEEALRIAPQVDALLLDSGNPNLKIKELGGTGRTHDWELSRKIRRSTETPLFLAGGLNPGNVRRAIDTVEPYGVDVCSGLRTEGKLDERKLEDFFTAIEIGR